MVLFLAMFDSVWKVHIWTRANSEVDFRRKNPHPPKNVKISTDYMVERQKPLLGETKFC